VRTSNVNWFGIGSWSTLGLKSVQAMVSFCERCVTATDFIFEVSNNNAALAQCPTFNDGQIVGNELRPKTMAHKGVEALLVKKLLAQTLDNSMQNIVKGCWDSAKKLINQFVSSGSFRQFPCFRVDSRLQKCIYA